MIVCVLPFRCCCCTRLFGHPRPFSATIPPFGHPLSPVKERESAWSQFFFGIFFFFSYFVVRIVVDVLLMLPADC